MAKKKQTAALLPFYLKLYDETVPELRDRIEKFLKKIAVFLSGLHPDILELPICREENEFNKAIDIIIKKDIDLIFTLHLAYSPSQEAIAALKRLNKPLIILDTTPLYDFGPGTSSQEIMYNHGIHGVQDICNLLKRENINYIVVAGHVNEPSFKKKIADAINSVLIASAFKKTKAGSIGGFFKGMGDFYIEPDKIESYTGIKTIFSTPAEIAENVNKITEENYIKESEFLKKKFSWKDNNRESFRNTILMNLAVRKWVEDNRLDAFTLNFNNVSRKAGFRCIPFLEACLAMTKGIGYAGEGDIITAALVGAFLKVYPLTTFTEMFCPNWGKNMIFLSHMGEVNLSTVSTPLVLSEITLPFIDVDSSLISYGRLMPGDAFFVNLAPLGNGDFNFIVSEVQMLEFDDENFSQSVRGWMSTKKNTADFLEEYSSHAGTHHSALIYFANKRSLVDFGRLMNWNVIVI